MPTRRRRFDVKTWFAIALAIFGLVVGAFREFYNLSIRVAVLESTTRYLHGTVHVPESGK